MAVVSTLGVAWLFAAPSASSAGGPRGVVARWLTRDVPASGQAVVHASSMAVGPDSSVYHLIPASGRIVHQDPNGKFLNSWSAGLPSGPSLADLAVLRDGRVAVSDPAENVVRLFGPDGTSKGSWGGSSGVVFSDPRGLAVSPTGQVAVWDDSGTQILNPDGSFVRRISNQGIAAGSLHMALGTSDLYTVLVSAGGRGSPPTVVLAWPPTGSYTSAFPGPLGEYGAALDIAPTGTLWIADDNSRSAIAVSGGREVERCSLESLAPVDVAVAPSGDVFVTESDLVIKLGAHPPAGADTCSAPRLSRLRLTLARHTRQLRVTARTSDRGSAYARVDTLKRAAGCWSQSARRIGPRCVSRHGRQTTSAQHGPALTVRVSIPCDHRATRYRVSLSLRDSLRRRSNVLVGAFKRSSCARR